MNESACPPEKETATGPALTDDTLFAGRLICRQYRKGYRFSVDAVLAASFCAPAPGSHVLDLGCGCGVISLIVASRHPGVKVTGLEIQPELASLAGDNFAANSLAGRAEVIAGDFRRIRELVRPESFDLVVCNPPYREPGRGRLSRQGQRAGARHEIHAALEDVVRAASFAVKNRSKVVLVYQAARVASLIASLKMQRLEPKKIQPVYSYPGAGEATLVLVEAVKNGGEGSVLHEPQYIYACAGGPLTDSMKRMYE